MYVTSNTFFVYGNGYLLCFTNKANIFPTANHFTRCEDFFLFFNFLFLLLFFFFESVPMNIVYYTSILYLPETCTCRWLPIRSLSIGTGIYCVSVKNKANIFPTANHFTRCEDEISVERYFTEIRHCTGEELPWTRKLLLAIFSRK